MATKVSFQDPCYNVTSMSFDKARTLRGEEVVLSSLGGNYVIDINGNIYENSKASGSCKITLIGGKSRFVHQKDSDVDAEWYMTDAQKGALLQIVKFYATVAKFKGQVTEGNDRDLHAMAEDAFNSYKA